ncbi:transcription initiation factor IIB-like [Dermatophagoides pteronyssinus]|uniref:General transcription factor TFIIB n=2 Tax=Dermatophagoides pteronyssinus TaxID=6956 RepID=A0A6P6XRU2_DERPT|nr:transcription initiation factor IIB-like [Dermatophagoides pteronyssinus]KAH9419319.1 Transcription initiation factor IIB [Dermatophagoides pteronyssinus]
MTSNVGNHNKQMIRCEYCPEQTPLIEDYHAGDMICSGCGLVIGDRIIDVGAEWRKFSNDQVNKSRVGSLDSELYESMNLSTFISNRPNSTSHHNYSQNNDANGNDQSSSGPFVENPYIRRDPSRPYYNKKYLTNNQRAVIAGFKDISEMAEKLQTTRPVIESAQMLFKQMKTKLNTFKSSSIQMPLASACLYVAYRNQNVPRTFKEICAVSKATKREIAKCYKIISKEIGQTIVQASVIDYIPRFVAHLGLSNKIEKSTIEFIPKIESILSGRNPSTIASLAILFAIIVTGTNIEQNQTITKTTSLSTENNGGNNDCKCCSKQLNQTIRRISEVTGAAETTIKEVYHIVKNQKYNELFPNVFALQETN